MDTLLQPPQIPQVPAGRGWLDPMFEVFRALPDPVFDVAVGERKIGASMVAIRGQIDPHVSQTRVGRNDDSRSRGRFDSEGRVQDVVFVDINEDEQLAGGRIEDVRILVIGRRIVAVNGSAHVVTAGSGPAGGDAVDVLDA